jgi:hypothetical protein
MNKHINILIVRGIYFGIEESHGLFCFHWQSSQCVWGGGMCLTGSCSGGVQGVCITIVIESPC